MEHERCKAALFHASTMPAEVINHVSDWINPRPDKLLRLLLLLLLLLLIWKRMTY